MSQAQKNYANASANMVRSNYSESSIEIMHDAERLLEDEMESKMKYAGMSHEDKMQAMISECDEISACNDVYDYYND